ncbi:MAG: hypothetical protein U0871_25480 [Gemmataceae bacterium]
MATIAEWEARQRQKMLSLYARNLLSPVELIGGLLDSYTAGREADELAADPPAVRAEVRAFLAAYRPDRLPPVFVFGRATAAELAVWYREREGKYAALLAALGLQLPAATGHDAGTTRARRLPRVHNWLLRRAGSSVALDAPTRHKRQRAIATRSEPGRGRARLLPSRETPPVEPFSPRAEPSSVMPPGSAGASPSPGP